MRYIFPTQEEWVPSPKPGGNADPPFCARKAPPAGAAPPEAPPAGAASPEEPPAGAAPPEAHWMFISLWMFISSLCLFPCPFFPFPPPGASLQTLCESLSPSESVASIVHSGGARAEDHAYLIHFSDTFAVPMPL